MININPYNRGCGFQPSASMKMNGFGTVNVDPDLAMVNLGIITENISLEAAQKENSTKANAVINQLLSLGVARRDINTLSYNVEPQYDYVEGKQVFRGYRVSNILSLSIRELNRIGEIIDEATANGANSVNSIVFKLENPSLYYSRALKLAMQDAILKARELGNTLGVRVNEIPYKISEESSERYLESSQSLKFSSAATPILPGEISISALIEAYFVY